jgi:diaminopimelate epimerase
MRYSLFDPTGNITALVERETEPERQPEIASDIMRRRPEVEQVGFVRFDTADPEVQAELRMAGGEFCGNACMSAAALYCLRQGLPCAEPSTVRLRGSGARKPVEVRLKRLTEDCLRAAVLIADRKRGV